MSNGITMDQVDNVIDDKIKTQRHFCFKDFLTVKDYYKSVIKTIIWILGICVLLFSGVIAWSYAPIKDIATLKVEIRVITEKLDQLIERRKE